MREIGAERVPVVLVHGWWMPAVAMRLLGRRLARDRGFDVHGFRYASARRTLDANADALHEACERIPGPTLHFVGHSLGGIVILRMLRRHGWARPGRVVALGTLFLGSAVARRWAARPGARRMIGPALAEAANGGEAAPWSGPQEIGILAGTIPLGFGRFVGRIEPPHDGTVRVDETRLPGATDHRTVPVTHTGFLVSRTVAALVGGFLEHGRFPEWTR